MKPLFQGFPALIVAALLILSLAQAGTAQAGSFGAVGIGPGGAYGFAHSYSSASGATNRVQRECHGNCTIIRSFFGACGAISSGNGGAWGWAYAPTRARAETMAQGYCRANGSGCRVRAWACSF